MGRDAGFIALNAGIAGGATEILIPEDNKTLDDVVKKLEYSRSAKKTSNIVLVAEGDQLGDTFKLAEETQKKLPEHDIRVSVLGPHPAWWQPNLFRPCSR